nr:reverse transcriptase domain-containing protein [Tanacetum cinerariifolium]
MATNENGDDIPPTGGGDSPVPDLQTMQELNSFTTFEQMAKMFIEKYFPPFMVTKLKNEITNFRQRPDESLFEAWKCYKLSINRCPNHNMLPVTQIDTFYNGLTLRDRDTINAAAGGTFMKRHPEECYDLIENMTTHHNDWDASVHRSKSSSSITSSFDPEIVALKAEMAEINKNLMKVLQINQQLKEVTYSCKTCGGPHSYNDCPATIGQTQNVYAAGAYNQGVEHETEVTKDTVPPTNNRNTKDVQPLVLQVETQIPNSKAIVALGVEPVKAPANDQKEKIFQIFYDLNFNISFADALILMPNGTAYQGPTIPTTSPSPPKVVERDIEVTKDTVPPTNNESTKDVQPPIVQVETPISNSEPVVAPVIEPVVAPIIAPKPNQKPSIPYPSRLHDQKLRDKANDQKEKIFKIFQDLNFTISFADALILMSKFGPTIKSLLTNKDKLYELARTSLNEHCSVVLLKKLPEKLRDPGKFFIPCDFQGMDECLALADLGASINLMPLSVWNKLSLPELSPTYMTLKLADRSIFRPVRVANDIFVKVGAFHFSADFVVVDFDADPRVPLILGRFVLKTGRALIDVYAGELTL